MKNSNRPYTKVKLKTENYVKLICHLPNSTHLIKPLDRAVYCSVKGTNVNRKVVDKNLKLGTQGTQAKEANVIECYSCQTVLCMPVMKPTHPKLQKLKLRTKLKGTPK